MSVKTQTFTRKVVFQAIPDESGTDYEATNPEVPPFEAHSDAV